MDELAERRYHVLLVDLFFILIFIPEVALSLFVYDVPPEAIMMKEQKLNAIMHFIRTYCLYMFNLSSNVCERQMCSTLDKRTE